MSDNYKLRVTPLLSGLQGDSEYDAKSEKEVAELEIEFIELERQAFPYEYLKSGVTIFEIEFEKNLIQFALSRKISLLNPDWRDQAMQLAATEHPDLDPRKRPRGRPRKTEPLSVLFGRALGHNLEESATDLGAVEFVQAHFREHSGKEISDAAACRVIVAMGIRLPGITQRNPSDDYFVSQVRKLQNRVSRQRQLVGRPKRRITKKP